MILRRCVTENLLLCDSTYLSCSQNCRNTEHAKRPPSQRLRSSPLLGSQNSREFGNIVPGVFTPVLAKHTKSFNLIDTLAVGFEPLQRQVELWRKTQVTDERAKLSRAQSSVVSSNPTKPVTDAVAPRG